MVGVTVTAIERTVALLADPPAEPDTSHGYLDLLGEDASASTGLVQALMLTSVVPRIYRRWWRPALSRLAKGLAGPSMADEHTMVRQALQLAPGDTVLDVACGPGNFTRDLGQLVGDGGLAVGIDASRAMLDAAVRETVRPSPLGIAYVRGDAVRLPFADGAFDAVCCFAALHLFADPFTALDHMLRVLLPGGRIAILTSARAQTGSVRIIAPPVARVGGMRMFERDEITGALADRGAHRIRQRIFGAAQFVSAQTRVR